MTDGYDSDSSGGEDDPVVPARKGKDKDKGGEEGEDEDMFGELDETVDQEMDRMGKGKERERKQAGKEWLEMGDIEGQEFGKKDMRDDHDDDQGMEDQDEGDEEDEEAEEEEYEQVDDHANDDDAPRSRRSKKGMGFQLSSVFLLLSLSLSFAPKNEN